MKLNQAFEIEAAMTQAKHDKDDLVFKFQVLMLKAEQMENAIAVANAYLRAGQYEAARRILESL